MEMVTHPDTGLMVATLTRTRRRWMVMLWDGAGTYQRTEWHKTRREALARLTAHCLAVVGPDKPWPKLLA